MVNHAFNGVRSEKKRNLWQFVIQIFSQVSWATLVPTKLCTMKHTVASIFFSSVVFITDILSLCTSIIPLALLKFVPHVVVIRDYKFCPKFPYPN